MNLDDSEDGSKPEPVLSDDAQAQFEAAVQPVMDFLQQHLHPDSKVIVSPDHAEIVQGMATAHSDREPELPPKGENTGSPPAPPGPN